MKYSVIIPTFNDAQVLDVCLEHLSIQDFRGDWEIIVVDDGSTDNTSSILEKWKKFFSQINISFSFFQQENKKQGAARNRGVKESLGDILLFIGSDILVSSSWLSEHVKFHEQYSDERYIALGFMTWSPELAADPFRQWLESSGTMLSYKGLKNLKETDFWHFYTGNISLKKSLFEKYFFDEDFSSYGWEDIMLGYQMLRDGAKLLYLENAIAYHHHALTEEDLFPKRMQDIGKSAILFQQKFPEVPVIPKGLKLWIFKLLSLSLTIQILSFLKKEWAWYAQSKKYFLEGLDSDNK